MLWGDFADSWLTGSNAKIIATETQKNTVYKLAQDSGSEFRFHFLLCLSKSCRNLFRSRQSGRVWQVHRCPLPEDIQLGFEGEFEQCS